jgi:hypothetical protein
LGAFQQEKVLFLSRFRLIFEVTVLLLQFYYAFCKDDIRSTLEDKFRVKPFFGIEFSSDLGSISRFPRKRIESIYYKVIAIFNDRQHPTLSRWP